MKQCTTNGSGNWRPGNPLPPSPSAPDPGTDGLTDPERPAHERDRGRRGGKPDPESRPCEVPGEDLGQNRRPDRCSPLVPRTVDTVVPTNSTGPTGDRLAGQQVWKDRQGGHGTVPPEFLTKTFERPGHAFRAASAIPSALPTSASGLF